MIQNLNQLKKAIRKVGAKFEIVDHWREESIGQVRVVQCVQTNAIYSGVYGQPDHHWSTCNYGKGLYMPFKKASDWSFKDGLCIWHNNEKHRCGFAFRLIED